MSTERRQQHRYRIRSVTSSVTAGAARFEGMVQDVSPNGLRIAHLPRNFDHRLKSCTCVISGPEMEFHVEVEPCWSQPAGFYKEAGFRIVRPPPPWRDFIRRHTLLDDWEVLEPGG